MFRRRIKKPKSTIAFTPRGRGILDQVYNDPVTGRRKCNVIFKREFNRKNSRGKNKHSSQVYYREFDLVRDCITFEQDKTAWEKFKKFIKKYFSPLNPFKNEKT